MAGYHVAQRECAPVDQGDGAQTRVTIGQHCGCENLIQSVVTFPVGRTERSAREGREQSVFVLEGAGTLELHGSHALALDTAAYIKAGEQYAVENPGPAPLTALVVDAPTPDLDDVPELGERKVTVSFSTQPSLEAGIGRTFRLLVDPQIGCAGFTQFLGEIPPGRAPDHSHTYDEVVYVVEGEGLLHMSDETRELKTGSCIYLPPLHVHCLENTGTGHMRVLGVFQPAGSPAARYAE